MATISHPAFRIMIEKFGYCDEYFTEMINAGTLLTNGPFEKYYIDPTPVPQKVVWQRTGRTTEHMEAAAKELVKLPGIGIDINMGKFVFCRRFDIPLSLCQPMRQIIASVFLVLFVSTLFTHDDFCRGRRIHRIERVIRVRRIND